MAVDERDWDFETKLLRGTDALHQLDGDEQGREFDSGESDDECQPSRNETLVQDPSQRIASRSHGNTGPKGVKADYENAKKMMHLKRELKNLERFDFIKRIESGAKMEGESISYNSQLKKALSAEEKDEDSDDEFFQKFREMRMKELRTQNEKPKFGTCLHVDKFEFLSQIESKDGRSYVVVHLFEDCVRGCPEVNRSFSVLARKYPTIRFLKMLSTEAKRDFDEIALPAILVYKDGQLMHSLLRITQDLGDSPSVHDVQWLLMSHDVFEGITEEEGESQVDQEVYSDVESD